MTTGEIIQRERTRLGLSQEKLAEQVGVSRPAVVLAGRSPGRCRCAADVRFPSTL